MISKPALAIVSILGIGTATTSGVLGYKYFFNSENSLLSKLQEELRNPPHKKILTSRSDVIWNSWKEFYGAEKTSPISGISKEELPRGCEENLVGNDKSNFDLVSKGCVVNTRSVREELKVGSKKLLEEENNPNGEDAWNSYNTGKGGMEIEDSTFKGVNATQRQQGGPALKAGCNTYLGKKMYEFFEGGKSYEKVSKGCVKTEG